MQLFFGDFFCGFVLRNACAEWKGSAQLACDATGYCDISVNIVCSKLSTKQYLGILYLVGVGIKIMAATFIARVIYEGKLSEVTPDINAISP